MDSVPLLFELFAVDGDVRFTTRSFRRKDFNVEDLSGRKEMSAWNQPYDEVRHTHQGLVITSLGNPAKTAWTWDCEGCLRFCGI